MTCINLNDVSKGFFMYPSDNWFNYRISHSEELTRISLQVKTELGWKQRRDIIILRSFSCVNFLHLRLVQVPHRLLVSPHSKIALFALEQMKTCRALSSRNSDVCAFKAVPTSGRNNCVDLFCIVALFWDEKDDMQCFYFVFLGTVPVKIPIGIANPRKRPESLERKGENATPPVGHEVN